MKSWKFAPVAAVAGALMLAAPAVTLMAQPSTGVAAAPQAILPSFAPLVKAAQPAVVAIRVELARGTRDDNIEMTDDMREFMERFFGRMPGERRPMPRNMPKPQGLGSGFIIDKNGIVVTNNHVVDKAEKISVVLSDGSEYEAELVGTDPKTDIAVLRVEAERDLPTVPWGNSDEAEVGDWGVAIGNPFGFGGTVTAGIISARGRSINAGPYDDFLQIDASINRGNSGGPLFDQTGHVIGVNTAIYSPSGVNAGIGFAIPSNQAQRIVADLLDDGEVERGWLGVSIQQVDKEIAESMELEESGGALIREVTENGPAEKGGLRRGDVITAFGGVEIKTVRDLTRAVADTLPGVKREVTVLRDGKPRVLSVQTGRFPT